MESGAMDDATRFASPDDHQGLDFDLELATPLTFPSLGDYDILEKIGAGGMGQVFRARHRTMQRDVALKILPRALSQKPDFVDRFYSEVRAVAKLMHPNIVTAFDAGFESNVHYLVMELIEGVSLSAKLATRGTFTMQEAVDFLVQAGSALQYAHSQGVIHRDIKPSNMMMTNKGVLKILDFGLAGFSHEIAKTTERRQLVGTVEYMSPEQIEQPDRVDSRTDLYSLGASLFYLLTSRPMFSGEPVQIALAHLKKTPPALYEVRSDIDLRLDSIFQRLVAKNPGDRFQDADALLEQLESSNLIQLLNEKGEGVGGRLPGLNLDPSTIATGNQSTSQRGFAGVGIDLGTVSSRVSYLGKKRELIEVPLDGDSLQLRNMLWSDGEQSAVGDAANKLRATQPAQILYGVQRWFGLNVLERPFAGRQVPPEILLAVQIRAMMDATRIKLPSVSHAVVNVPACYDQLHRQSVATSCRCAGIEVLQLLDKPLAAAISFLETRQKLNSVLLNPVSGDEHWMVVELSGSACEASIVKINDNVAKIVASIGDWKRGRARWQNRLAEHLAKMFQDKHGIDIRTDLAAVSRLQRSIELALDRLAVASQVEIRFEAKQRELKWVLTRDELLQCCGDLASDLVEYPKSVMASANISGDKINQILFVGDLLQASTFQNLIRKAVSKTAPHEHVSKADLARGAALQAQYLMPPTDPTGPRAETTSSYDIALMTLETPDAKAVPRVLIPKGSPLPASFSRTLRFSANMVNVPTLQFAESTRLGGANWHRLGHIDPSRAFPGRNPDHPLQLSLELDGSGLLSCKLTWLAGNSQQIVPPLAEPTLDPVTIQQWHDWIETLMLCSPTD